MNCMLWEDQFYEDGVAIAERIARARAEGDAGTVAAMAIEAREEMKLRHAPLLVVREMARHEGHTALVADTLERIIQRPDELTEFLAIYWADALGPMQQRKKRAGLGAGQEGSRASVRQVRRLPARQVRPRRRGAPARRALPRHAKPKDAAQEKVWKQLVDGTLASPDTWEVSLSGGATRRRRSNA